MFASTLTIKTITMKNLLVTAVLFLSVLTSCTKDDIQCMELTGKRSVTTGYLIDVMGEEVQVNTDTYFLEFDGVEYQVDLDEYNKYQVVGELNCNSKY